MPHIGETVLFWAALAMYLADGSRKVNADAILLEVGFGSLRGKIWRHPTRIFGTQWYLPIARPFGAEITVAYSLLREPRRCSRSVQRDTLEFLSMVRPLCAASGTVFCLAFLLVPLITIHAGLYIALSTSLPVILVVNVLQFVWLRQFRSNVRLSPRRGDLAHMLLCPIYGANFARRVASRFYPKADGLALCVTFDRAHAQRWVLPSLVELAQASADDECSRCHPNYIALVGERYD